MPNLPIANPFSNGIVPDAWTPPVVDVPSIHADVSDLCLQLLDEVATQGKRRSILVSGAAGSGKTHVLSRVRQAALFGAVRPRPLFSYVRLTTSPNMIRRHLRHALARDLVRKDDRGVPCLESLLLDTLAKESGGLVDVADRERFSTTFGQSAALRAAFDEACTRLGLDCRVACACRLFLMRNHRHAVVHWLESGELPDDTRTQLECDLGDHDAAPIDPERTAFQVVIQLIALITDSRPLVLCFDQLEAMQISVDDPAGYFAFGRLASDLFDHCHGLLLITCVQTAAVPVFMQSVPAHDFHRIAQHEAVLEPLSERQARELIRARLDSSPTLRADPRRRLKPLWPIDEERFRSFLAAADATPRRLCALGREAFATAHRLPLEINGYLTVLFEQRRSEALDRETGTGTFVQGLALLLASRGFAVTTPDDREDVDLIATLAGRRLLVTVCNDDVPSLARHLRAVIDHRPHDDGERLILREARRPIPPTARRSWEYWHRLASNGEVVEARVPPARTIAPTNDAIAALEAVRSLMADSRAGDLEAHGETVMPSTVEGWIQGHLRDESLRMLGDEIEHGGQAGGTPAAAVHQQVRDAVLEILQQRHVMPLEDLGAAAHCGVDELRTLVTTETATFGTLGSPPVLVFDRSVSPR